MFNFVLTPNLILGVLLSIAVILFHSIRYIRPELTTDSDIFFSTIGLLYSYILVVHGWRLDPILMLGQVLIVIIALAGTREIIYLRALIFVIDKSKNDK